MIGVVIVWTRAKDDVRLPFADQARDEAAVFDGRQQLAIMNIEHFASDAEDLIGVFGFGLAPSRERPARLAPVADVTVRH